MDCIATSFPCGLRGFHVYQEIWKPIKGEVLNCVHDRKNIHDRYAKEQLNVSQGRLADSIVGHFPREILRFTRFLISRGGVVKVTVDSHKHRRSPLVQGGLRFPLLFALN